METLRKPSWGSIQLHVLLWMILVLLVCTSGCGVRKTDKESEQSIDKTKDKSSSEGSLKKDDQSKEATTSKDSTAKVKEQSHVKTTEEFNPDGTLNKRTTETTNKKSTDNSTRTQKSFKSNKTTVDSIFNNKVYQTTLHKTDKTIRETERSLMFVDQVGGVWVVLAISAMVILALFFLFKRK